VSNLHGAVYRCAFDDGCCTLIVWRQRTFRSISFVRYGQTNIMILFIAIIKYKMLLFISIKLYASCCIIRKIIVL